MKFHAEEITDITPQQYEKLESLKELYTFWNQQINVISRKNMEQFELHHVLHSLSIARIFDFTNNHRVMDLGCGGGFPGIPLAICFPEVQFHLVDSIGKKIKVVKSIASSLQLPNVTAEQSRAEHIHGRRFDCVISRAVAPLRELIHWSKPLIDRKNADAYGLICLKGGDLAQEISESGKRVRVWDIYPQIYGNDWFREKYILQIPGAEMGGK